MAKMNGTKLIIALLVGFALGGGMTYYGYASELDEFVENIAITEQIEGIIENITGSETTTPEEIELEVSKYRDCSGKELLSETIKCNRYNSDIAQAEHNKKYLEEQMKIARGF